MSDRIWGQTPLNAGQWWDDVWLRPLYTDPYWVAWRNVWQAAFLEWAQSQWLTRWKRSVTTAEGAQLVEQGLQIAPDFPRPDGWSEERYRDVLIAFYPGVFAVPTPAVAVAIAEAVTDGPQTFVGYDEPPLSQRFSFQNVALDDGTNVLAAMSRARANGAQMYVTVHPDEFTSATLGVSVIDGVDTLGIILTI